MWITNLLVILFMLNIYGSTIDKNLDEGTSKLYVEVPQLENLKSGLEESNRSNQNLFFVSVVIAIGTIIGTALSVMYMKKQSDAVEREINQRLRPWIIVHSPKPSQVFLQSGGVASYDDWMKETSKRPIQSVKMRMKIENTGAMVARNITEASIMKDEEFKRNEFETQTEEKYPDLPPGQDYAYHFVVPLERWHRLEETNLIIGLSISYDNGQNRSYSGGIFGIRGGSNYVIDTWYID